MSCHGKVTHYRDGFAVKNKWTETCGLLSLLHLGLLFCHINIRAGPHYTPLLRRDGSAGSAPRAALGCAGEPHPGGTPPGSPPGAAREPPQPRAAGLGGRGSCGALLPRHPRRPPRGLPPSTVASPWFARAGSAGTSRPLSKCGDAIVFILFSFCPGAPEGGWQAGRGTVRPGRSPCCAHSRALCYLLNTEDEALKRGTCFTPYANPAT